MSNMAIKRSARRIVVALVATLSIAGAVYFALALAEVGKHKDKLWLHRCNSIEKLNEKYGDYTNVELDVCFRDSVFDVTHDIDSSFGLNVEKYFAFFALHEGKMWLDLKNLTLENSDAVHAALTDLTKRYGVDRSRLIVESPHIRRFANSRRQAFTRRVMSILHRRRNCQTPTLAYALTRFVRWQTRVMFGLCRSPDGGTKRLMNASTAISIC